MWQKNERERRYMKIKCPYKCYEEFKEFDKEMTEIELANHFNSEHNQVSIGFSNAKLIFKIHEKIELVEKLQETRQKEFNEIDFTNDQIIKELKSLLEDKN